MSNFKEKFKNHKKMALAGVVLLLCLLGAGGYYGWTVWEYRQSPACAVEKLTRALNPPDRDALVKLVDFGNVSHDLANAIAGVFPFVMAGKNQERDIGNALQSAFLRAVSGGTLPRYEPEGDEAKDLQKPLVILPPDFTEQIAKNLTMRENSPDAVILATKVNNPQLGQAIPLIFNMRKGGNGWVVRNFLNAKEVAEQVRKALLQRHARLREVYEEKNNNTRKKMDALLPILSCSADGGLLSNGKLYILVVHLLARNRGDLQASNFSVDVSITGKNGKVVERRYLNAAMPVAPGEDFDHRWSFELDSQGKLAQELMAQTPLKCEAAWQTLGVSNSQVWHIEAVPNPDKACLLEGHSHPEGFCLLPIFLP